jgi:hypothetical protein
MKSNLRHIRLFLGSSISVLFCNKKARFREKRENTKKKNAKNGTREIEKQKQIKK